MLQKSGDCSSLKLLFHYICIPFLQMVFMKFSVCGTDSKDRQLLKRISLIKPIFYHNLPFNMPEFRTMFISIVFTYFTANILTWGVKISHSYLPFEQFAVFRRTLFLSTSFYCPGFSILCCMGNIQHECFPA